MIGLDTRAFPYLVVDDFLSDELLSKAQSHLSNLDMKKDHPAGYSFSALYDESLIRYFYRFIKNKVNPEFKSRFGFSPVYKLPQIYQVKGPWVGIPPHLDNQNGRDLAMILYLSQDWMPGIGGELQLLDKNKKAFLKIEPIFNRAVFFPLGTHSWHEVLPIEKSWTRTTLIQDWAELL